jgi:type I restriction-modification system DNA methylase subunit
LVVVPDGFLNRQNDKHLRKYLLEQCYLDAIISLPLKTFFTTTKKTYILVITKKHDTQKEVQIDPVFTYLVSEVGETMDIYRFDTDTNHLNDAVDMYNFYKAYTR